MNDAGEMNHVGEMNDVGEAGATSFLTLELALPPQDAERLPRLVRGRRTVGGRRGTRLQIVWHDTPDGLLAAQGLALAESRHRSERLWRLERMRPADAQLWPPGTPAPVVAQAGDLAALAHPLPGPLLPVAAFEATERRLAAVLDGATIDVLLVSGTLRAVTSEQPVCRVTLAGPAEATRALAMELSADLPLSVPAVALSAAAYATARPAPPPRRLGAPRLPPDMTVGDGFAYVVAHLTDVILHHAPGAQAGETQESVHQMRVALRRLRSAVSLFKRAVKCPELERIKPELKALGKVLGPARDWDVFTAGTGHAVAQAFHDDAAVGRLITAAERQRSDGYAALRRYLDSAGFRRLGIDLAALSACRPWEWKAELTLDDGAAEIADAEGEKPNGALTGCLGDYAAEALQRRLQEIMEPGDDISDLPPEVLHGIRLHAKRLRYAAEFFAPLFPRKETRRFIRRVTSLQERLGALNDGAVAAQLMAELGGGAGTRAYAAGVVRGFVAAQSEGARAKIDRTWRKFRRLDPFWR